jgi:hypothetical protein
MFAEVGDEILLRARRHVTEQAGGKSQEEEQPSRQGPGPAIAPVGPDPIPANPPVPGMRTLITDRTAKGREEMHQAPDPRRTEV